MTTARDVLPNETQNAAGNRRLPRSAQRAASYCRPSERVPPKRLLDEIEQTDHGSQMYYSRFALAYYCPIFALGPPAKKKRRNFVTRSHFARRGEGGLLPGFFTKEIDVKIAKTDARGIARAFATHTGTLVVSGELIGWVRNFRAFAKEIIRSPSLVTTQNGSDDKGELIYFLSEHYCQDWAIPIFGSCARRCPRARPPNS